MSRNSNFANAGVTRRSFLAGLGAMGLGLGLAACSGKSGSGSASESASSSDASASAAATDSSTSAGGTASASGKILVAYFTGTGHTERVAKELASDLGADVFQIEPADPYTDDDLDYGKEDSRVVQEYENKDQRDTELKQNAPDNFADYQTVLVGYPIWWSDAAWAMHHFASKNDFTGKTVIPFCTSFSSGLGSSGSNLAEMAGTGDWQEGRRFDQDVDLKDVRSWAQDIKA